MSVSSMIVVTLLNNDPNPNLTYHVLDFFYLYQMSNQYTWAGRGIKLFNVKL